MYTRAYAVSSSSSPSFLSSKPRAGRLQSRGIDFSPQLLAGLASSSTHPLPLALLLVSVNRFPFQLPPLGAP